MPSYKILGIFSFAENLKEVNMNEQVKLRHEKFNIKSKNAIGVYVKNKKIGYLPVENNNELLNFKNSYKISKLQLNQEYPLVEISRYYSNISNIENYEFDFIKKIKYDYQFIDPPKDLTNSLQTLILSLKQRRINVKRAAFTYIDDNYVNLSLETNKGIETFNTVTFTFFNSNIDKYEELLEFNLIEHTFYKDFIFHRIEKYIETNYTNIVDYKMDTEYDFFEMDIYDPLISLNNKIDLIYFTKLYLYCLIVNNFDYITKYIYRTIKKQDIEINDIIQNINELNKIYETYEMKLGGFYYNHEKKIYSQIDFINDDTVIIISPIVLDSYILNCELIGKNKLIIYNPLEGTINKLNF